jgi:putative hydrolase of the HAD superfamily
MATEGTVKAVLIDAMGTLIRLVPPAPMLARALGVDEETAERAFRAEVAYYVEHHLEGRDADDLRDLRARCAQVIADETGVEPDVALGALLGSIHFEPFEDAAPALAQFRALGLRVVVVSNWDCSLPEVLADAGLAPLVDAVVVSAVVGAAKPDRAIFDAALKEARCAPGQALHIGDSVVDDLMGAVAAGLRGMHLDRAQGQTLGDLAALLSSDR